ncbi:hypothetical protein SAMN04515674_10471 [Pseudarcicella hirudinis]|uniref:Uncharacterized protein n=1 Tax=Pseudarcicella hirudinis TaxID=1079859 RepID=A0A1I5RIJ9_9BACT|nr:hypothetical protein SAMN04515674_10471 [Pseudarcicella hirudinis]
MRLFRTPPVQSSDIIQENVKDKRPVLSLFPGNYCSKISAILFLEYPGAVVIPLPPIPVAI